jgi:hypothetical protein
MVTEPSLETLSGVNMAPSSGAVVSAYRVVAAGLEAAWAAVQGRTRQAASNSALFIGGAPEADRGFAHKRPEGYLKIAGLDAGAC